MRVTILQGDIEWANPTANVQRFDSLIDAHSGSDLYVLPEMFSTGFCTEPEGIAESAESDTLRWMQQKSAAIGAAIAGMLSLALAICIAAIVFKGTLMFILWLF